jgi:hypothetical protein
LLFFIIADGKGTSKEKIWALKFDGVNTLFVATNTAYEYLISFNYSNASFLKERSLFYSDSGILRLWDYNREKCFSEAIVKSHLIKDIDLNIHHLSVLSHVTTKLQIPLIPYESPTFSLSFIVF